MDAAGIDVQAVSAPPFVFASMSDDQQTVTEVTRRSNDALADYASADRGRLCSLGTVPIGQPDAAGEAERCLDELGMAGLTVGTYGAGR
jgi:aminocarboxymuconate-semialdehyde decarboxylase